MTLERKHISQRKASSSQPTLCVRHLGEDIPNFIEVTYLQQVSGHVVRVMYFKTTPILDTTKVYPFF